MPHIMDGRTTVHLMGMVLLMSQTLGLVDPTVVGDMLMKDFIVIEGVHLVKIYMIEICIQHHPLLARCGLSLEEILTRNLQLTKITEGTKGLEVETEGSSVLKTATKQERTALKEIINMAATAVIWTMRGAGERVAGEGMTR